MIAVEGLHNIQTCTRQSWSYLEPCRRVFISSNYFCSPIRYTMYLQCIFGHFELVAGRTPVVIVQRLGLARSPTAVNYFCHASMPGGCLMSEKSSVDFRSILISQGLDLRCYGHRSDIRRYKTVIGHGWIANESDRWRYPNILTPVSFSNHLSDAT